MSNLIHRCFYKKHFLINNNLKNDRCMSEDDKKEIEPIFTAKC